MYTPVDDVVLQKCEELTEAVKNAGTHGFLNITEKLASELGEMVASHLPAMIAELREHRNRMANIRPISELSDDIKCAIVPHPHGGLYVERCEEGWHDAEDSGALVPVTEYLVVETAAEVAKQRETDAWFAARFGANPARQTKKKAKKP